jgi:hypothetical protein
MDYTVEGYDIRIEVREDGLANYHVSFLDHAGKYDEVWDEAVLLDNAFARIIEIVRSRKAGAF